MKDDVCETFWRGSDVRAVGEELQILSCTNAGECRIQLTMCKDRYTDVKNSMIKGQALTAVESCSVRKAERKLSSLNSPGAVFGLKFKVNPW